MITCGILFLALSLSPCSALRFPRSRNARVQYVKPGSSSPLQLNDLVQSAEALGNMMIRREGPPIPHTGINKGRKVKDYDVKVLSLDNMKSLELDKSLEKYLALDAQEKQKNVKKNVGFKVVNINDFDTDRQKSKTSNRKKVKLVQSLAPPKSFFKKYSPNKIVKESADNNLNIYANNVANMNGNDRKPKSMSIFDKNGMMFLSKPKDVEGRKLTNLINKVMKIKAKQELQGGLRQPSNEFSPDEMKQIRVIAQAIDEEDRDEDGNNELDQLLLREILQGEVNEPPAEDGPPLKIVVAEMSPKPKQIKEMKMLSKPLRLNHKYDNENDELDESESNAIAQLISQVLDQERMDGDDDINDTVKVDVVTLPESIGKSAQIANREKEKNLKQIGRAIQEAQQDAKPEPAKKVDHQFNFEDLVA